MCREKIDHIRDFNEGAGSPLRVQGKDLSYRFYEDGYRITPACAGKRISNRTQATLSEDHPCVCREKQDSFSAHSLRFGSPLRVQGKEEVLTAIERNDRITPACAGKSVS